MNTTATLENDIRHADRRHPVDFLEPLPTPEDQLHRICEVLSRTFGWVAEADTVEQKGLHASVVLYCVRADLLGAATLEQLGAQPAPHRSSWTNWCPTSATASAGNECGHSTGRGSSQQECRRAAQTV